MKNTDPLMGAELKSKTHLQKFAENANKTPKDFFWKKSKKISKNAEFYGDFESVEKVVKYAPKKLHAKQVWRTWVHFFQTFSTDSKSAWNSAILLPILNFVIKKCSY